VGVHYELNEMGRKPKGRMTFECRFLSKVNKTDTCWLWTGRLNDDGYGHFDVNTNKAKSSHRVAYELWVAPIPDGLYVRHKCDVRNCVNPDHLEVGTQQDNVNDMFERGRHVACKGERNGRAKLTEDDVREIRVLLGFDISQRDIAKQFNVGQTIIYQIKIGKSWAHVQ
jgi:hypothetical protein